MSKINTIFGTYESNEIKEETKKGSISPFDIAKIICTKKDREKVLPYLDTYKYSQFMLNQIFAQEIQIGYDKFYPAWKIIKDLNIMKISNRAHFDLLWNLIPENQGYLKYRFKQIESKEEKINALKWYFPNEDEETIYKYVNIIANDEAKEIMEEYEIYKKTGVKK